MSSLNHMLTVDKLCIGLPDGRVILDSIDLTVQEGSCHVIMGPNGSGKSSLLSSIMGLAPYEIRSGSLMLHNESIAEDAIEERSGKGIFMSFQSPVAIPGVSNLAFYKAIVQQKHMRDNLGRLDSATFMKRVKEACAEVGLPESFLKRDLNDDFSGGERKRNELLQMLLLEPRLVLLDEIDSGLDIDAMRNFSDIIKKQRDRGTTFLVVTHYHKFMESLAIDHIHVLFSGKTVASGHHDLIEEIDKNGYQAWA